MTCKQGKGINMNGVFEYLNMITVNQHSSVRLSASGKVLYVDPFELPAAPKDADFIFLTHSHFDHFSPKDIEKLCKPETVFVLPASMEAEAAQTTQGHRVAAVGPSDHVVPFHPRENAWVGYLLHADGLRIYVAGDTDATEEAGAACCDIAMLPIGGKYTMNAAEAAALANRIRPQVVIPIHYGSVVGSPADFDRFAALVDPAIRVHRVISV